MPDYNNNDDSNYYYVLLVYQVPSNVLKVLCALARVNQCVHVMTPITFGLDTIIHF